MTWKKVPSGRCIYTLHGQYRFITPEWAGAIADSSLGNLDEWSSLEAGEKLAVGGNDVFRVNTPKGTVIFKRYRLSLGWRYFMRPGRSAGEWAGLNAMEKVNIPVPERIGFGEDRWFGRLVGGYIITWELESTMDLATFALEVWYAMEPPEKQAVLKEIRSKLFDLVKRAHDNNLFHRDLIWRNILVRKEPDGYRLWFIDCPRLRHSRMNRAYLQMVDLSSLTRLALSVLTVTERYRSLLIFMDGDRTTTRKMFRKITSHHAKRDHKKSRKFVTKQT